MQQKNNPADPLRDPSLETEDGRFDADDGRFNVDDGRFNVEDNGTIPDDPLTGHSYDGIQEFDNPMPGWWKNLFLLTIVFAIPYLMYYHSGVDSRSLSSSYDAKLAANMELQFAEIGDLTASGDSILKFMGKPSWVKFGGAVFKTNCISCHGQDGGGLVGPNLCDEHFKNIRNLDDFIKVMENGAGGGAMPAWKNRLSTNEIVLVSAYVASLRGSNPANPKAPLGNVIPAWPEPPADDKAEDSKGVKMTNETAP
ncbi:MAG: cbb3-type cytochrome c oxidase N-terminal domain-containing protein [Planctomycetota bacterium]